MKLLVDLADLNGCVAGPGRGQTDYITGTLLVCCEGVLLAANRDSLSKSMAALAQ